MPHGTSIVLHLALKEWLTIIHGWEMNFMAHIEPCSDDVIKRNYEIRNKDGKLRATHLV